MKRKFQKGSPEELVSHIKSGDRIASTLANGNPYALYEALYQRRHDLENVDMNISLLVKPAKFLAGPAKKSFTVKTNFMGPIEAKLMDFGTTLDPRIIHLNRIPRVLVEDEKCNIIMLQAAPPDEEGRISLGVNPIDRETVEKFNTVMVQFNKNMPFVYPMEGFLTKDDIDYYCEVDEPLVYLPPLKPTKEEKKIAELISEYVRDGDCIQLGIGSLAKAFVDPLKEKKHLGCHTELFSDPFVELIKAGAVDNSLKKVLPGKSLFAFAMGTKEMHDFLDHNEEVYSASYTYVNDPEVIRQNDNVVSVNSALEVDLTGQVCSESIGFHQYSGTGGQVNFVRGASLSKGGRSFIAFPSTYYSRKEKKLASKIKLALTPGAAVTTLRTDVEYLATEYGVAYLANRTIHERVKQMIGLAHPDFRDELRFGAKKCGLL